MPEIHNILIPEASKSDGMPREGSPWATWILVAGAAITIAGLGLFLLSFLFWGFLALADEASLREELLKDASVHITPLFGIANVFFLVAVFSWPWAYLAGGGAAVGLFGSCLYLSSSLFRTATRLRHWLASIGAFLTGGSLAAGFVLFTGFFSFTLGFTFGGTSELAGLITNVLFGLFPTPLFSLGCIIGLALLVLVAFTQSRNPPSYSLYGEETPKSLVAETPKQCPKCSATNPPDARYCLRCGTEIPLSVSVDPGTAKRCPQCATENPYTAKFCWKCGKDLFS